MRTQIYICDQCQKTIGDKVHITIAYGGPVSGISLPPDIQFREQHFDIAAEASGFHTRWTVSPKLNGKFHQYCNPECLKQYFAGLVKIAIQKPKVEKKLRENNARYRKPRYPDDSL